MSRRTKKAMPWLLIVFGFLLTGMLPPFISGGCMLVGIVMLIERIWPEQWGTDSEKVTDNL